MIGWLDQLFIRQYGKRLVVKVIFGYAGGRYPGAQNYIATSPALSNIRESRDRLIQ